MHVAQELLVLRPVPREDSSELYLLEQKLIFMIFQRRQRRYYGVKG